MDVSTDLKMELGLITDVFVALALLGHQEDPSPPRVCTDSTLSRGAALKATP